MKKLSTTTGLTLAAALVLAPLTAAPAFAAVPPEYAGEVEQIHVELNQARVGVDPSLTPFEHRFDLDAAAQARAEGIDPDDCSHFPENSPKLWESFPDHDHLEDFWAENLSCFASPDTVVGGWMDSASHREQIVSEKYNSAGIGIAIAEDSTGTPRVIIVGFFANYQTVSEPDSPINMTIIGDTSSTVQLQWDAPENDGGETITNYHVVATRVDNGATVEADTNDATTSLKIEGLQPGRAYTFTVAADNSVGRSAPSTPSEEATLPGGAPLAPTNVTVNSTGDHTVDVAWEAPFNSGSAITSYHVSVMNLDTNREVYATDVDASTLTVSIEDADAIVPGTSYNFTVTAVNEFGFGKPGSTGEFRTPAVAPDQATIYDVRSVTPDLRVTWDAPFWDGGANITSYDVVGVPADGGENVTTTVVGDETTAIVTGLTPGVVYDFTVVSHNAAGESVSDVFTQTAPVIAPTAPQNTNLVPSGTNDLVVSWEAPANNGGAEIDSYVVSLKDEYGATIYPSTTISSANLSHRFEGLMPGQSYTAYVSAVNVAGASVETETVETQVPPIVPYAPADVTVSNYDVLEVEVSWFVPTGTDGGSPITGFVVTLTNADDPTDTITKNVDGGDVRTTIIGGVSGETSYIASVQSVNIVGAGAKATSTETVDVPKAPGAPSTPALTLTNITSDSVDLTWALADNGGANIISYHVVVTNTTGDTLFDEVVPPETTSITVDGLDRFTFYQAQIVASNAYATSNEAVAAFVTKAEAPSTPTVNVSVANNNDTTISWNVADDGGSEITRSTVNVYDADNTVIKTINTTESTVVVNGLNSGETFTTTVVVRNNDNSSTPSTATEFITYDVPAPVAGITAHMGDSGQNIVWGWDTTPNAVTITIKDGSGEEIVSEQINTVEYVQKDVKPGETYTATITTSNAVGESTPATAQMTVPATAPSTPQNVKGEINNRNNATITWDAPKTDGGANITEYTVTLKDGDDVTVDTVTVSPDTFAVTFDGLDYETNYTAHVVATNSAGNTPSNVVTLTTGVAPTAPSVATEVKTLTDGDTITATWGDVADDGGSPITGFIITLIHDGEIVDSANVDANTRTHTFKNVGDDSTYTVGVTPVNNIGAGELTLGNTVITKPSKAPSNPTTEGLSDSDHVDMDYTDGTVWVDFGTDSLNNTWVYGYGFSTPTPLGWSMVDNNWATYTVEGMEAGTHTLVLYDADENLVGWGQFTIPNTIPADETDTTPPATTGGNSNNSTVDSVRESSTSDALPRTGAEGVNVLATLATLLIMVGFGSVVYARTRQKKANPVK